LEGQQEKKSGFVDLSQCHRGNSIGVLYTGALQNYNSYAVLKLQVRSFCLHLPDILQVHLILLMENKK